MYTPGLNREFVCSSFFFIPKYSIWTKDTHRTAFLRRTTTCKKLYIFTKSQPPIGLKKTKKKQQKKTNKKKQHPRHPHKNIVLYLKSPPPPLFPPPPPPIYPIYFSSGTNLSCCVVVCTNACKVYLMPKGPLWAYVCMYVCLPVCM